MCQKIKSLERCFISFDYFYSLAAKDIQILASPTTQPKTPRAPPRLVKIMRTRRSPGRRPAPRAARGLPSRRGLPSASHPRAPT